MTSSTVKPRVLFLTPFNFADPANDEAFDRLVEAQLGALEDVTVVADHVTRIEADDEGYDAAQTSAILESLQRAESEGYDAFIIACHYDPALGETRAAASLPVIGPLQLTSGLAEQYGDRFAVVTDVSEAEPYIGGLIDGYGRGGSCAWVRAIGLDGDEILADTRAAADRVDALVREAAAAGDIDVVLIGCTIVSAAYEAHRSEFADHGVRVLNSNLLTVRGAAMLA